MLVHRKAVLFILISAISGSLFALFSKIAMKEEMILLVMMMRFLLPLLMLTPFFIWIKIWKQIKIKDVPNQILRASFVTLGQYAFFFYLTKASLLNANVLINSSPIFMPLIAKFVYGQRFSHKVFISSLIGLLGVVFVTRPTLGIFSWHSLIGVFSGISVAFSYVLFGINRKEGSLEINLFYFFFLCSFFSIIVLAVSILFFDIQIFSQSHLIQSHLLPLFILSVSSILNQVFRGLGYKLEKPAVLAPLLYISVALTGVYGWVLWQEIPSITTVIGCFLILLASLLSLVKSY